jgi:hypothetical protein
MAHGVEARLPFYRMNWCSLFFFAFALQITE